MFFCAPFPPTASRTDEPAPRLTRRWLGTITLAIAVGTLGCEDRLTGPPESGPSELTLPTLSAQASDGAHKHRAHTRFHLALEVEGELEPGSPITIRATGTANLATQAAELRIVVPEREAALRSRWGNDFRIPVWDPLPALTRETRSLTGGQSAQISGEVTFPVPGYYRVVATIVQRSDEPRVMSGLPVQDVTHRTVWLLVSPEGGQITDEFRPDEMPPGTVPSPGPFRDGGRRAPPSEGVAAPASVLGTQAPMEASVHAPQPGPNEIFSFLSYYNQDEEAYHPVAGASYQIDFCQTGGGFICDSITGSVNGATDTDWGGIYFECAAGDDGYDGAVTSSGGQITVTGGPTAFGGQLPGDCGFSFDLFMESERAHVFTNMRIARAGSQSLLAVSRGPLTVKLDTFSGYLRSSDEVHIKTGAEPVSHVWGGFGPFVAAHEYGHAVHHTALGGLGHFDLCPIPHFVNGAHNFGCAVKEGFANWHAIVVMAEVPHLSWRTEIVNGRLPRSVST